MSNYRQACTGFTFLLLTILILTHPQSTYNAAASGLTMWWEIVVPALLPFFLASNLLIRLGIVRFLGVFLEPLTRPLFNLPGPAALVITLGYSSGPPVAAAMIAELRRQGLCTRQEGEKLLCFTHNASPLFMLGAIPVGMFGNAALGPALAGAHYLANLTLGFLWRPYGRNGSNRSFSPVGSYWQRSLVAMQRHAQENGNRPLSNLLAEAISHSFRTLVLVAGYITAAAVLLTLLDELHLLPLLARGLGVLLKPLSLSPALDQALAKGLVEVTVGTQTAAQAAAPLADRLAAASIILGWSGLAIHGQVASVLAATDIRLTPFLLSRVAQGLLAAVYLRWLLPSSVPAFVPLQVPPLLTWTEMLGATCLLVGLSLAVPASVALVFHTAKRFWPGAL